MTFIINPISGTSKEKHSIEKLIADILQDVDIITQVYYTSRAGHAHELTKKLATNSDFIVAVGGDGTVNEIAQELVNNPNTSLGIVPMGSGNGLARSLNIPLETSKAIEVLRNFRTRKIDTCTFNQQPFFCTAGIGFDAEVAKEFDLLPERGLKAYFQACFKKFKSFQKIKISSKINSTESIDQLFMMAFANAKQYGYGAKINPISSLSDGKLEVVKINKMNLASFAEFALRLFFGTVQNFKDSEVLSTSEDVYINSSARLAHLDGEPINFDGRAVIKIIPNSLTVLH